MKLTQLTAKPQLIKIELNDEEILKEYGEPIEFWIWDRQPMSNFVKFASLREDDVMSLMSTIQDLVLDEQGNRFLSDETTIPIPVLTKVVSRVVETLGK
jgi:hypothetical protein